jgi:TatD DNase family protein
MSSGLTDTHCHLNHSQFDEDRLKALERARQAGVKRLLVIGFDLASSRFAVQISSEQSDVQAVVGIHPEACAEWSEETAAEIGELAARDEVVAIGEIGLDYHWDSSPRELQQQVFTQQIALASGRNLPIVIHCRDAYSDVMDTLTVQNYTHAVLHCFTGTAEEARRAVDLGCYLGVGGIATFKKSDELRAALREIPLDRLLLETDAPYLAPQPWRGKRNEPAYIRAVAELLASERRLSFDETTARTSANADALFGAMR